METSCLCLTPGKALAPFQFSLLTHVPDLWLVLGTGKRHSAGVTCGPAGPRTSTRRLQVVSWTPGEASEAVTPVAGTLPKRPPAGPGECKEVRGLAARGNMTLPQRFMAQEAQLLSTAVQARDLLCGGPAGGGGEGQVQLLDPILRSSALGLEGAHHSFRWRTCYRYRMYWMQLIF